ncbi:MAG: FlgO family outer membrane protein [Desulfovibrionaceae bacterium]|nr:FlgO family outer membrane protein [Desulfovibrionaceae bacterium]
MRIAATLLLCLLLPPAQALADTLMTKAASAMGREMHRQLAERFGEQEGTNAFSMIVTTPVDLNNLEESNAVARQMQEELSRWFIQTGYNVQEVRQGKALLMRPSTGELLLTRNKDLIPDKEARSALTLVGTYSMSSRNMTFNVRLVRTGGPDVYAMSNITLPVSGELRSMLSVNVASGSSSMSSSSANGGSMYHDFLIEPSVFNRLP